MNDTTMLYAVASDRMRAARQHADAHRVRRELRRDLRSVVAVRLQRLAVRVDGRDAGACVRDVDRPSTDSDHHLERVV